MLGLNTNLLNAMAGVAGLAQNPAVVGTGIAGMAIPAIYNLIAGSKDANEKLLKSRGNIPEKISVSHIRNMTLDQVHRAQLSVLIKMHNSLNSNIDVDNNDYKPEKDKRSTLDKILHSVGYENNPIGQLWHFITTGETPSAVNKVFGFDKRKSRQEETDSSERARLNGISLIGARVLGKTGSDILRSVQGFQGKLLAILGAIFDITKLGVENTIAIRQGQGFELNNVNMRDEDSLISKISKIPETIANLPGINALTNLSGGIFNIATAVPNFIFRMSDYWDRMQVGMKNFFSGNLFRAQDRKDQERLSGFKKADPADVIHAQTNLSAASYHLEQVRTLLLGKILRAVEITARSESDKSDIEKLLKEGHLVFNEYTGQFTKDKNYYQKVKEDMLRTIYNQSFIGRVKGLVGGVKSLLTDRGTEKERIEAGFEAEKKRVEDAYGKATNVRETIERRGINRRDPGYQAAYNEELKKRLSEREARIAGVDIGGSSVHTVLGEHGFDDTTRNVRIAPLTWRQRILQSLGMFTRGSQEEARVIIKKLKEEQAGGEKHEFESVNFLGEKKSTITGSTFKFTFKRPPSPERSALNFNVFDDITPDGRLLFIGLQALENQSISLYSLINSKIVDPLDKLFQFFGITRRKKEEPINVTPKTERIEQIKQIEYQKESVNHLAKIAAAQPDSYEKKFSKIEEMQRWNKLIDATQTTSNVLTRGKIGMYLRDFWEKIKFGKKKKEGEDESQGFFGKLLGGLGNIGSWILGGIGSGFGLKKLFSGKGAKGGIFSKIAGFGKGMIASITGGITGIFSSVFGKGGFLKNMFSKSGSFLKNIFRVGGSFFKKLLGPLSLLFIGKDVFDAWTSTEEITGESKPSFLQKIGSGVSGLISSLTFGLIEPKTIYNFFSPALTWITTKIKDGLSSLGGWFMSSKAVTNFKEWDFSKTFSGAYEAPAGSNIFQRFGHFISNILSSASLGMVKPDFYYNTISGFSTDVVEGVKKLGGFLGDKVKELFPKSDTETPPATTIAEVLKGVQNPGPIEKISAAQAIGISYLTGGLITPQKYYEWSNETGKNIVTGISNFAKSSWDKTEELTVDFGSYLLNEGKSFDERLKQVTGDKNDFFYNILGGTAISIEGLTGGIVNAEELFSGYTSLVDNTVTGTSSYVAETFNPTKLKTDFSNYLLNEGKSFDERLKQVTSKKSGFFYNILGGTAISIEGMTAGIVNAEELFNDTTNIIDNITSSTWSYVKDAFTVKPVDRDIQKNIDKAKQSFRDITGTSTPGFFQRTSYELSSYISLITGKDQREIYKSINSPMGFLSKTFDKILDFISPSEAAAADIIPESPIEKIKKEIAKVDEDDLFDRVIGPTWRAIKNIHEKITTPVSSSSSPDMSKFGGAYEAPKTGGSAISSSSVPWKEPSKMPDSIPSVEKKVSEYKLSEGLSSFKGLSEEQLQGDKIKMGDSFITPDVYKAIAEASQKHGVPLDYMLAMARQESNFDPTAKAKTSSATGLYQFISKTWKSMWKGGEVPDPTDPYANADAGARYAKEAASILGTSNPAALYLGHFLGPYGAKKLLSALESNPNTPASAVVGKDQMAANSSVFSPGSTVQDIFNWSKNKMNTFISKIGGQPSTVELSKKMNESSKNEVPPREPIGNSQQSSVPSSKQTRTEQNIEAIGSTKAILDEINEIKQPVIEPIKENKYGPYKPEVQQPPIIVNNNSTPTSISTPPPIESKYEKKLDPQLAFLDDLFNSAIVGFKQAGVGFVFGESLNANTVLA